MHLSSASISHICLSHHLSPWPEGKEFLLCSLLDPQCFIQYLAQSRCSINICWMTEWIKRHSFKIQLFFFFLTVLTLSLWRAWSQVSRDMPGCAAETNWNFSGGYTAQCILGSCSLSTRLSRGFYLSVCYLGSMAAKVPWSEWQGESKLNYIWC